MNATTPADPTRTLWNAADGPVTGTLTVSRRSLGLADELALTLSVEGPAPLRIDRVSSTGPVWKAVPAEAVTVTLPGGRERWSRTTSLRPLRHGDVPLPAVELVVGKAVLRWDSVPMRVTTIRDVANPGEPAPVTGIDPRTAPSADPPWGISLTVLLALLGLVALLARLRRRPTPRVAPATSTFGLALHRLQATASASEMANGLSAALRAFVESTFGVPAGRRTTDELLADLAATMLPADERAALGRLLTRCDEERFSPVSAADRTALLRDAEDWVLRVS